MQNMERRIFLDVSPSPEWQRDTLYEHDVQAVAVHVFRRCMNSFFPFVRKIETLFSRVNGETACDILPRSEAG